VVEHALEIAPAGPVEAALVDRLAAAFQRLEKAELLAAQLFDGAFRLSDVPPGMRLYRRTRAVPGRRRASAGGGMTPTPRTLEGRREGRRRAAEAWLRNEAREADC